MLSHSKTCIIQSMSALQPYLSICGGGPWHDFVARQTSFSISLIVFLFTFCGVIFPYQYHSSSDVWKEERSMLALLFALLLI